MGLCNTTPKNKDVQNPIHKANKVSPSNKSKENRTRREISRKYKFGAQVLGVGQYGKVFLA